MKNLCAACIVIILAISTSAFANPGQSGSTGLISVPSADTLDSGNICIGAWTNFSNYDNRPQKSALILPVSITLGIGTFWEIYGAYPNILFNGDEDASGRGTLDLGTKLRFLGDRSSLFKVAADFLAQRRISENLTIDGATDLSGKLIASYSTEKLGLHAYAGYLVPGKIPGVAREDEILFGAGVEYMPFPRTKLLGELTGATNHYPAGTLSAEASVGMQYFLSPHLTFNVSAGTGLGQDDARFRVIAGLSSCQGVGSYVTPIPSVGKRFTQKEKAKEPLKPLKIIPISTLLLKPAAPQSAPVSKLEVEVESATEDVLIKAYGQVSIEPQQASSNLSVPASAAEVAAKTRSEEITLRPQGTATDMEASAFDYTMSRLNGMTPLYGLDVKGTPQVSLPAASGAVPERMAVYRIFRFPDVTFDFDQSSLSDEGRKMLAEATEQIRKDKKWLYLRIDGHTDSIGSVTYNMDLSLKRAIAVATQLISREGIDASRIFVKGLGKSAALADNSSAEGRKKNRRTEIVLLVKKDASP